MFLLGFEGKLMGSLQFVRSFQLGLALSLWVQLSSKLYEALICKIMQAILENVGNRKAYFPRKHQVWGTKSKKLLPVFLCYSLKEGWNALNPIGRY